MVSSVQSLSRVKLFATPKITACQASLSIDNSQSLLTLESVMPSSVILFSSCPQSFPASGSFQMSQLFISGGQSIAVSASASVLPMNIQDWSPLGWTGWISWQSKGLSRVFSITTVQKHQFFGAKPSLWSRLSHPYVTTGKNHSFDYMDLCWQSDVSAFKYTVYFCHSFSSKKQAPFNFMAMVPVHSDFGV